VGAAGVGPEHLRGHHHNVGGGVGGGGGGGGGQPVSMNVSMGKGGVPVGVQGQVGVAVGSRSGYGY
jgi:hypothetical protein